LDQIDKNILFHLENQARLSMTELGKLVGLSQPAVTERVKRMEEAGVIEHYRAIINPQKIGKQSVAYLLFRTRECGAFLQFCHSAPEVVECHRISGEHNYLLKVITNTISDLEAFGEQCDKYGSYTTIIGISSPIAHKSLIESEGTDLFV